MSCPFLGEEERVFNGCIRPCIPGLRLNAKTWSVELLRIGVGVFFGFDAGAGDEPAKSFFPTGAALGPGNEAVAINHDINRVSIGLIHGREIGVLHHHDFAVAGMLLEIFLDGLLGFADVNGENDQAFGGKLFADFVNEGRFVGAEAAPGGPELEQRHFALDGFVGELLAGGSGGGKVRSGFLVLGTGGETESADEQGRTKCAAEDDSSHAHGAKIAQIESEGLGERVAD